MSHVVIDRRLNDHKKSLPNRQRYLRRVREQVRQSIKQTITNGSIADTLKDGEKKVRIRNGGLNQPEFRYLAGSGTTDHVISHNQTYRVGDKIAKRKQGGGGSGNGNGNGAGNGGGGLDAFEFTISKEEFMDIFFEDLELPNMRKKNIEDTPEFAVQRAGFSTDGPPSRLNILRSMKMAKARRMALRTPKKRKIKELLEKLAGETLTVNEVMKVQEEIELLKRRLRAIPYIDDIDLRYHFYERKPKPSTKAVIFGILDVSGSMSQYMKELAKRFFILALLFIQSKYEKIDIVWIRHTSEAAEVTEEEFFHSRETGGTVVSTALALMSKIQKERYPTSDWNIYGVQMSDGDNLHMDNDTTKKLMTEDILPVCQYFAYVEVHDGREGGDNNLATALMAYQKATMGDLYSIYTKLSQNWPNFAVACVTDATNIYPVFRRLFRKQNGNPESI